MFEVGEVIRMMIKYICGIKYVFVGRERIMFSMVEVIIIVC